jgi:hypothetical protein
MAEPHRRRIHAQARPGNGITGAGAPLVELGRAMTEAQDALEAAAMNLASGRLSGGDPLEHADRLTKAASAFHTAKEAWLKFQAAEFVAAQSAVSQAA